MSGQLREALGHQRVQLLDSLLAWPGGQPDLIRGDSLELLLIDASALVSTDVLAEGYESARLPSLARPSRALIPLRGQRNECPELPQT